MKKIIFAIFLSAIFLSCSKSDSPATSGPILPTLTTSTATAITTTTARIGGNVSSEGGATVTIRGICWSTTSGPIATGDHSIETGGAGSFYSDLTLLTPGLTYYSRAYATNSVGTAYGNEISFTTNFTTISLPTLTTSAVTAIGSTFATCGGNISSDGGGTVTARGVCWSTATNPVATGNHTTDGNGNGAFVSSLTGLTVGITYYVRAYATNSEGTAYGNEVSFMTF